MPRPPIAKSIISQNSLQLSSPPLAASLLTLTRHKFGLSQSTHQHKPRQRLSS
ncbi:hypothetical protein PIIN_11075 [Serendipita indica DSM 11827]|uniref:Uncharacterized protein n=1 Tax=Serendipita indica (strain DSM 11827) TaxID=1109443 RepID=G4U0J7_SERID|nr:hypothetical protein PIIN_11075 [Serendipita indica DSM 11827]